MSSCVEQGAVATCSWSLGSTTLSLMAVKKSTRHLAPYLIRLISSPSLESVYFVGLYPLQRELLSHITSDRGRGWQRSYGTRLEALQHHVRARQHDRLASPAHVVRTTAGADLRIGVNLAQLAASRPLWCKLEVGCSRVFIVTPSDSSPGRCAGRKGTE